ncbi:MAG: Cysteine desulfurase [candidate division WS6 bacterium GW2011_GWF2_39_15]|uniref:cysteine desulfurase n=1 Tax=candidate division WS6 bacterium GW2011_GWF2_39_15 TaxID=1619100 RepID=A0A0G0MYE1_9BACT|nr:MAG: Cysteine desulfurase [candidate division WS6 bacterium GW2011_GWF2_39_15]
MNIKSLFPLLQSNPSLIYLDSASTTQKPSEVINSIVNHYETSNANVHRGLYGIAHEADKQWIKAHEIVSKYINAKTYKEVFFTKNSTEGLNWIANTVTLTFGNVIVISEMEHHSNLLPWLKISKEKGIIIEKLRITEKGIIDTEHLKELIAKYGNRIKVVSIVHQSNVLGTTNPVQDFFSLAKEIGALTVLDCAQSIAHMKIDVQKLGCDVMVFSSHKVYGPSGVGVVYCKEELLNTYEPWLRGGEMVKNVEDNNIVYNDLPWKFEAGTPAIEAGVGLGAALVWFEKTIEEVGGWETYQQNEKELTNYLTTELKRIEGMELVGGDIEREGIVAFNIKGIHPHDIASLLDEKGICVRAGYHCVQPLHDKLGLNGSTRVSLGIYNTKEDIDSLIKSLWEVIKSLK